MVDVSLGGGPLGPPQNLPPYNETNNPKVIGILSTFLGLAIIVYFLRMWSRIRINRVIGLDDYAITIALVNIFLCSSSLMTKDLSRHCAL
jgi:hypothetical protein